MGRVIVSCFGMGDAAGELVLTPDEMSEADRHAARLIPSVQLMENAGRAVARAVMASFRPCRVVVACGPGNNGGDGYVAARLLAARGWPVAVAVLEPPRAGTDCARAAGRGCPLEVSFVPSEAARADLVLDALFGAGLSRPMPERAAAFLAAARRVVAVDLPSGLDGLTGLPLGTVRAAEATVTFVRRKPGHLLLPGRMLCGRLILSDIGMPEAALAAVCGPETVRRNVPGLWRLREPSASDHKYSRGTVVVSAGSRMGGAALLAARAARRAGAGLVRLSAPGAGAGVPGADPGLIVDTDALEEQLRDGRRKVWVCGPGLEPNEAALVLPALLADRSRQVVADGGALGHAAGQPERLCGVAILTPHAGEFARVFGAPGPDRVDAARAAARAVEAVVVLKGADTIVVSPDGRAAINDHATPALATAGSGDTLAGIAGAMLAEGLAAYEAACAAVWLHGEAGARAGDWLIAEDLADRLPAAMAAARVLAAGQRFR